ncbi:peptidoglycan-binding protein [Paenibacillus sp. TRM 82003]|nr:peptidoglycan-binding protein [Paenibacillus sp. TRM 82003]
MNRLLIALRNRARIGLTGLALVLALTGAGGEISSAAPANVTGADVYAVQAMLKSMGYYTGTIDGSYGTRTATGVRTYQQRNGLTATGTADAATLRSIISSYAKQKAQATAQKPAPAPTPTQQAGGGGFAVSKDEAQMAALVNKARADAGLPPLTVHTDLSRVARYKSDDMAVNRYFSHDSPTYGSPFQMMTDFGVRYSSAGENIACNQTVDRAHTALMNSPGHRANIMSTDFTHIGIGIVSGGQCGAMYTQMFMTP